MITWVPGTWVMAPETGLLWTPAYWGWRGNGYVFYGGYWGQQVGFYGGISYGYGYFGDGYEGGRWQNGQFFYNRSVNNVNVTNIHNVYNTTVTNSTTVNRVSYNGGSGGLSARPTPQQEAVAPEKHIPPVAAQTQHAQAARANPEQRASANHGKPAVAATPKPGAFSDRAAVPAKAAGAPYTPPVNRAAVQPTANMPAAHPESNAAPRDQVCRITRQKQTGRQQTGRTIDRSLTVRNQFRVNQIIHRRCIRTIQQNPTGMSRSRATNPFPNRAFAAQRTPPPEEKQRAAQEQQRPQQRPEAGREKGTAKAG